MGGRTGYPDFDNANAFGGPTYFEQLEIWADGVVSDHVDTIANVHVRGPGWGGRLRFVDDEQNLYVQSQTGGDFVRLALDVNVTGTATIPAGWNTVSVNSLVRRSGVAFLNVNVGCNVTKSAGAVIATLPANFAGISNIWSNAWGLSGAANTIQVFYDVSTNTVKLNQAVTSGQAIALSISWPLA